MHKKTIITTVVSVLVLCVVVIFVAKMQGSEQKNLSNNSNATSSQQDANPPTEELKIEDVVIGEGQEAVSGQEVTVHYTGTFTNGAKFDSSVDRNQPFTFTLGRDNVLEGWHRGIAGMKVGGKRKLTIPPSLAYGAVARGNIPANSTLIFEIELLEVK